MTCRISLAESGSDRPAIVLAAISGADGTMLWSTPLDDPPRIARRMDLDGDGEIELVLGRLGGRLLAISPRDGTTLWEADVGGVPSSLLQADADGDGLPEVWARAGSGMLHCLDGRTGASRWVHDRGRTGPSFLADLDGDSIPDLVTLSDRRLSALSGATRELLWEVDPGPDFDPAGQPVGAAVLAAPDRDGDRRPDVNLLGPSVVGLVSGRDGREIGRLSLEDDQPPGVAAGHFDGDDLPDLAVRHAGAVHVIPSEPAGSLATRFLFDERLVAGPVACDIDGDGAAEIAVAGTRSDRSAIHLCVPRSGRIVSLPIDGPPAGPLVAIDADRDGADEILVGTADGRIRLFSVPDSSQRWEYDGGESLDPGSLAALDLDQDGELEVYCADREGGVHVLGARDGAHRARVGHFEELANLDGVLLGDLAPSPGNEILGWKGQVARLISTREGSRLWQTQLAAPATGRPALAEVTGDAFLDAIFPCEGGRLEVLSGATGELAFSHEEKSLALASVVPCDFDLDARSEVLVVGRSLRPDSPGVGIRILEPDGAEPPRAVRVPVVENALGSRKYADLDRDGLPDAVIASSRLDEDRVRHVLLAVSSRTGVSLWETPFDEPIVGLLDLADLDGDRSAAVLCRLGAGTDLALVSCHDGRILWKTHLDTAHPIAEARILRSRDSEPMILARLSEGKIAILSAETGMERSGIAANSVAAVVDVDSDGSDEALLEPAPGEWGLYDLDEGRYSWRIPAGAGARPGLAGSAGKPRFVIPAFDLDGDGELDIATYAGGKGLTVVSGRTGEQRTLVEGSVWAAAAADLDGDSTVDFALVQDLPGSGSRAMILPGRSHEILWERPLAPAQSYFLEVIRRGGDLDPIVLVGPRQWMSGPTRALGYECLALSGRTGRCEFRLPVWSDEAQEVLAAPTGIVFAGAETRTSALRLVLLPLPASAR